jgi:hypothetical protein
MTQVKVNKVRLLIVPHPSCSNPPTTRSAVAFSVYRTGLPHRDHTVCQFQTKPYCYQMCCANNFEKDSGCLACDNIPLWVVLDVSKDWNAF